MSTQTTDRPGLSWKEVCEDPHLQDLPYKIETNERGQIVMSPNYLWHSRVQHQLAHHLDQRLDGGEVLTEAAIQTPKGTKVADVAWFSEARWEEVKECFDAPVAPELCIEIRSSSNTDKEMDEKRRLYLDAGAEEVWICDEEGRIAFYDEAGQRSSSNRAPSFPSQIEL
jgi:Uma2 family endonuclease